jgi:hypothetical protein
MPDQWGFTHEPHHGAVFNRCIECDEIPWGETLSEKERRRHHAGHQRERERAAKQRQAQALASGRKLLQRQRRELGSADG